ncbi:MAG TPA: hypothetical protein VM890_04845 [Longimicrobium sp.]|nr:hypothetical protein [Longimicrobium sp.]
MSRKWIFAAAAVALLLLGAALAPLVGGESAERRVRRHFAVAGALDTATLRAAVLREVPIGSPESRLARFAARRHLGADGASVYRPSLRGEPAVIRFDGKPFLDPVFESYIIVFEFDGARRLREVRVRRALTGP